MSVGALVALDAKSYEILSRVITQTAPRLNVMDLKISPFARTIGNASRLARGLPGRAGDKLQGQVSSVAALRGSLSKRHLYFFKELLPLRLRKTNDQPSEARQ